MGDFRGGPESGPGGSVLGVQIRGFSGGPGSPPDLRNSPPDLGFRGEIRGNPGISGESGGGQIRGFRGFRVRGGSGESGIFRGGLGQDSGKTGVLGV